MDLARLDPTHVAVPFFIASMLVEKHLADRAKARGRDIRGHEGRDSAASLAMGVGSLVFVGLINAATLATASFLYERRFFDFGDGWVAWVFAFIAWDFSSYWHHRMEHEHRLLWACHVSHHSSQYFNLTTALRQPWTPFATLIFHAPWALLGLRPSVLMFVGGLNLIYQFWLHTELVGQLPRWISFLFNTPSHHRVHHASNAEYLDKNYAGVFIVWDRIFGTFQGEGERPVYGLTKNIESYNPYVIASHEYVAMARDIESQNAFRSKLSVLWENPAKRTREAAATSAARLDHDG